jgi:hypothetical protein
MQSLKTQKTFLRGCRVLCIPVWACGCVSSISSSFCIISSISFRITLHHTLYCINDTKIEYKAKLRQMLCQNENVLRHEVSFGKYSFIRLAIEGVSFFTKYEKKGMCFFAEGSKTVCVQISRIVKKYITVIYMPHELFHTSNITKYSYNKVTKYYYNKVYSSLRIFFAASFNNLSTTSSIIEFAMLITSSASFISGSAMGLYGSGSGDSSVVLGKLLVRSHKVSSEVKIQKQYLCAFRVQQPL